MERYKRTRPVNINKEDKVDFKVKLARQSLVCGVIIVIVAVISLLKTDTAIKLSERIDSVLTYTVDYKATAEDIMNKINNFTKGEQDDAEKPDEADKN